MQTVEEQYRLVVIGGGLAGFCAAVSAARLGVRTCILQNRPVFGGNSSSEIRVTPHGACAFHAYARETGIISELLIEERATNHETIFENGWTNSVWDLTLYNMAQQTPNLTIHVNTDVFAVEMRTDRTIASVKAKVLGAETELTVSGEIFIDASGDGVVAALAGCEWRMGSEARDEFGEVHAPPEASGDVMGSSIHFKTKDTGRPSPFRAPDWAMHYEDASFFYNEGRLPKDERGGYWWIEIGIPYDTIGDNEKIRHELTRHALGVWDWMKNRDPKMKELTRNYALDWIGQIPGKRESRRIMGQYFMTENDLQQGRIFEDEIAFGGWFIDLHTPGGLLGEHSEPASQENYSTFSEYAVKSYAGPYGIPLRCLISRDMDNLLMAGRNISVSHAALGTVRVMNTTALMGQAAGTTAALSLLRGRPVTSAPRELISEIQQRLLRDGCFLPHYENQDDQDLARLAHVTASSEALLYGAGPESKGFHAGLNFWQDQPQYLNERIENRRGQMIAIGSTKIDSLEVFLHNKSDQPQQIDTSLCLADHIWDYRVTSLRVLAASSLVVPPGKNWVNWPVGLTDAPVGRYVRLDVMANQHVKWLVAGRIESGHIAMYQIGPDQMRRFGHGHTLSFKVLPAQPCYRPDNVISGVTRPHRFTNLWKSDPNLPMPQWLQLNWETEQEISRVEITFPGHLLREYHAYAPFYHDPQCPKDYELTALVDGGWRTLLGVKGNFQRHNRHALSEPVKTQCLRIIVHATNGDPSAQIFEVRCYR